jgi:hypothetical protein
VEGYNILSKVVEGGWDGIDATFGPWAALASAPVVSLSHSLLMCCLYALVRWSASCLLMMDSCSCRSLSISCCTLMNFSSAAASSSSTSSSQSCTCI